MSSSQIERTFARAGFPDRLSDVTTPFALKVQELRERRGLAQSVLEDRAGIARGYVSRLELHGKPKHPGDEVVEKLAKALDVPVRELREPPRVVVEDEPYPGRAQAIELLKDDERISAGTLRALRLVQREDGKDPGRLEWMKIARQIEKESRDERKARDAMFDVKPGKRA